MEESLSTNHRRDGGQRMTWIHRAVGTNKIRYIEV